MIHRHSVWTALLFVPLAVLSAPAEYKPELRPSTYAPSKARDPFGWSGAAPTRSTNSTAAVVSTVAFPFRLEGIMYDVRQPSAIINNQLVVLNKPVTLRSGGAAIEVRVTEITADRVVLEVGGRSVELKLAKPPPAP